MILSFALTKNEYEAGLKTVTRRFYHPRQTALWQAQWDKGNLIHDAWDKVPFAGGQPMVVYPKFVLTCRPYLERLGDMPEGDLLAEGGMVATVQEFMELVGKGLDDVATVIRFQPLAAVELESIKGTPLDRPARFFWPSSSSILFGRGVPVEIGGFNEYLLSSFVTAGWVEDKLGRCLNDAIHKGWWVSECADTLNMFHDDYEYCVSLAKDLYMYSQSETPADAAMMEISYWEPG